MDYLDHQAEESEGSSSDASLEEVEPKSKKRKLEKEKKKKQKSKKKKIESSDEEENDSEDEDEKAAEEMKGFIADEEEEEEQEEDDKDAESNKEDSELDEDDLDLIDENLGAARKKKRIIQPQDSDDDEDDRTKIQKDLFGDGEDEDGPVERNHSRRNDYDDDRDRFSESGQSEDDGFIVHEGGAPRHRPHRSRDLGMDGHALDEARDVFGVDDFNFDEFYDENEDAEEIVEDEEDLDDEDRGDGEPRVRVVRRKEKKSTLFDTMEPSELDRGYLAPADKKIMLEDRPERFLLRRTPVTETDDSELEREADWIYLYAFTPCGRSVSDQTDNRLKALIRLENDQSMYSDEKIDLVKKLEIRAPEIIKEILKFIRNNNFEVPFIASYRKEIINQVLDTNELWKIYNWDEKWCLMQSRKTKLLELMKRMHAYQTDTEFTIRRPIPESDMMDVEGVQTTDQLNDVSAQFHMYYGNELNKMVDWERHRQLEDDPNSEIFATRFKMSSRNDRYLLCVENGLSELATRFGLSAKQFADNLEYRKHDVEQDPTAPRVAAADYCTSVFPDAELALQGAMFMLAKEIARQPKVRDRVRMEYRIRAAINVRPTKQGREQMDEGHPLFWKRYLREKPIAELKHEEYLLFEQNKKSGNLEVDIVLRDNGLARNALVSVILEETPFRVDEYNEVAEEWNVLRDEVVKIAVNDLILPGLKKELHEKLLEEARIHVIDRCAQTLYSRLEPGPFRPPEEMIDEDEEEEEHRVRVLAICYALDRDEVSFGALVDQDGAVMDYVRLPHFTRRCNLRNPNYQHHETKMKLEDNERFKKFVMRRRPHLVVLSGENMDAKKHKLDLEHVLREMVNQNEIHRAPEVVIMDNEASKVYMNSAMALSEHADYPPYLRQAVSLARLVIDPLVEYSHLWNQDDDIFCLSLHQLQNEVPKEQISWFLSTEFINRVNEVGVDMNKCLEHVHFANLLQFVCGLGPRKAADLMKTLKQNDNMLESRTKLVMLCRMGPKVFMNCSGFIKINTDKISERTDQYVEVLDGTRVHPETYEWARKMAVDALEVDDSGDPTAALEEILTSPEKLRDLDLDAFAEELQRQGFGNRLLTLYDIRKELSNRYEDWRPPFQPPSEKQLFKMLTKESKSTLYEGKLVMGTVFMVQYKRLTNEQLENKQPSRDDVTGQWLCQWCHSTDFESVSDLYAHMDENKCPGQPVGIKIKLDNGLIGYVPNKLLSDKPESFKNPLQRVKINQPVYARVMSVNPDKFAVDLSCRSSDLQGFSDGYKKQHQDGSWDYEWEEKDKEEDDQNKQKKEVTCSFVKRVISHSAFKNLTYREAERLLASMEQGDAVIRPSSKSAMNLTVTWKVTDNVFAHIDVREEEKAKEFQLGKRLFIQQDEFEDLDEILARHIQPMASFAREITTHKYYNPNIIYDDRSQIEHRLNEEKRAAPSRIPYVFSPSGDYPGKFLLSYQARIKARHEYMTVTSNGIRFRQQMFPSLEDLLQWFKVHYRDPPPNVQQPYAHRR